MAYFKKSDILDYVNDNLKEIELKGIKPLNPEAEVKKRLGDEEDLIGFFWVDYSGDEDGDKIKMKGKSWYRINHDLYTDDRFAIDLYQAMEAGLTVSDVINKREIDKEVAKKKINDISSLESAFDKNNNKNGD